MTTERPTVQTLALRKEYGVTVALEHVDLTIAPHSVYALLGPNGAGKTTLLSILTTLILPTSGTAVVAGHDVLRAPDAVRQRIGVTFQDIVVDRELSGRDVLEIHGQLYRVPAAERRARIAKLVELVQLGEAIDRRVRSYSGGMKRRLELARGLLTNPEILFLDEPSQGLDPQNRANLWDYLRMLNREEGLTIVLTTHDMVEAETLAQKVGIIDHGKLQTEGTPEGLIAAIGADMIRLRGQGKATAFIEHVHALPFVSSIEQNGDEGLVLIGAEHGSRHIAELVQAASDTSFVIQDIALARPTLGDVFLRHTGRELRD